MDDLPKTWKDGKLVELTPEAQAAQIEQATARYQQENPVSLPELRYERSPNLTHRVLRSLNWKTFGRSGLVLAGALTLVYLLFPEAVAGIWLPIAGLAIGVASSALFARRHDEPFA